MSKPKLPNEFTVEELLKALEAESGEAGVQEQTTEFSSPVVSFLQAFDLKAGKELVSAALLFKLFKTWRIDSFIDIKNFNRQMNILIPSETFRGKQYYKTNRPIMAVLEHIQKHTDIHTKERRKSKTWQKHIERFLSENDLEPGKRKAIFVEADILYYVYNTWKDTNRIKGHIGYMSFLLILEPYLEKESLTRGGETSFGVSGKIKELINKEELIRWREGRVQFKGRNSRGKGKKKHQENKIKESSKHLALYPEKTKKRKGKI